PPKAGVSPPRTRTRSEPAAVPLPLRRPDDDALPVRGRGDRPDLRRGGHGAEPEPARARRTTPDRRGAAEGDGRSAGTTARRGQPGLPGVGAGQPALTKAMATRIAAAEEEVELLEAQRDTRKAYVRAAEVAVEIARVNLDRLTGLAKNAVISGEEVQKAKYEVE